MGFGHGGPTARGDVVEDHGRGASYPQIPAMSRLPFYRFKDVPPRFVPMEQLLAHLGLPQRLHDRLKERRDFSSPIGDCAWGEGDPMMLQRLTAPGRGAAIEGFVEQDFRPPRHPERAFGKQPRCRGGGHNTRQVQTATPLVGALALDTAHMCLDLDFNDGGLFGARKRPKGCPTAWAALLRGAQVLDFDNDGERRISTATVPRTAGLWSPLTGAN
jgi:hypothetical protein